MIFTYLHIYIYMYFFGFHHSGVLSSSLEFFPFVGARLIPSRQQYLDVWDESRRSGGRFTALSTHLTSRGYKYRYPSTETNMISLAL